MATLSELITTLKGKMLPLAGGTLTGALTAPSVSITNDNAKVNGKNIVRSVNGTSAGTDGNVTITVPSGYVHPNSGVTAGTYNNVTVNAQGHVTAGSNTSYLPLSGGTCTGTVKAPSFQISSDKRLKSDIKRIESALNKVESLSGYTYMLKGMDERQAGVIAQEVEKVLPEAVSEDDKGYKSVNYGALVALLINAINELRSETNDR